MKRLWIALVLSLGLVVNGWAADEWAVGDPAGTRNASDLDTYLLANNTALDRFLQYGRHDCKISYASASTITVGTGSVVCSNSGGTVRHLRANTAAVTVTWGMIDTGAEEASKTYYLWAVGDADATTFTVMVSLSSTAPTGATYYKYLGSFYNDASSNITQTVDDNDNDSAYIKGQGNYYKIDTGSISGSGGVSFSFTFAAAPVVLVSQAVLADHNANYNASSITTAGFTAGNIGGAAKWIAIGQVLAQ
jgi:hypothetical protein